MLHVFLEWHNILPLIQVIAIPCGVPSSKIYDNSGLRHIHDMVTLTTVQVLNTCLSVKQTLLKSLGSTIGFSFIFKKRIGMQIISDIFSQSRLVGINGILAYW